MILIYQLYILYCFTNVLIFSILWWKFFDIFPQKDSASNKIYNIIIIGLLLSIIISISTLILPFWFYTNKLFFIWFKSNAIKNKNIW